MAKWKGNMVVGHRPACLREAHSDEDIVHHIACAERHIETLEAAVEKALKHAEGNGMKDWPVFVGLRKAIGR